MAKTTTIKTKQEQHPDFISLRLEGEESSPRRLLEGILLDKFVVGAPSFLRNGKSLINTGLILEIKSDGIKTAEGFYKLYKTKK